MSPIVPKCSCGAKDGEFEQGIISGRLVCPECAEKECRDWKNGIPPHPDVLMSEIESQTGLTGIVPFTGEKYGEKPDEDDDLF